MRNVKLGRDERCDLHEAATRRVTRLLQLRVDEHERQAGAMRSRGDEVRDCNFLEQTVSHADVDVPSEPAGLTARDGTDDPERPVASVTTLARPRRT